MNPPPPHAAQPSPRVGLAIASLVLGILAFLFSVVVAGALFGLIGLVLGVAHLLRRQGRNGMAWAGLVLSVLGIIASIGLGALYVQEGKRLWVKMNAGGWSAAEEQFDSWKGVTAPDFSVTTLDGETIRLSELKGRRVIVDFWTTWSPPCVMRIPHFMKLHSAATDELVILGISTEDVDTLKSFVESSGVKYLIASADDLPAPYSEANSVLPTFFIDRKGVIQEVLAGYHDFERLKEHALADDFEGEPKPAPTGADGSAEGEKQLN
jgi:peroxiredoxin